MALMAFIFLFAGISFAKTKYIKRADIGKAMGEFSKALGESCSFCHVANKSVTIKKIKRYEIKNKEEFSAMRHQRVARAMIGTQMKFTEVKSAKISCMDCHQGKAKVPVKK